MKQSYRNKYKPLHLLILMRIPKKYGSYKQDLCPFCKKTATTKNQQQVPVCYDHKSNVLRDLTCLCGEHLELREGRYGTYFFCINCGNTSFKKALEMNPGFNDKKEESKTTKNNSEKKEITITSDQAEVHYSAD